MEREALAPAATMATLATAAVAARQQWCNNCNNNKRQVRKRQRQRDTERGSEELVARVPTSKKQHIGQEMDSAVGGAVNPTKSKPRRQVQRACFAAR